MMTINEKKCNGCGACLDVCKEGAIVLVDDIASINQDVCTECGDCIDVCPTQAIYSRLPAKISANETDIQQTGKQQFIATVKSNAVKVGKTLLPLVMSGIADMIISKLERSEQPTVLNKQNQSGSGKQVRQRRRRGKA